MPKKCVCGNESLDIDLGYKNICSTCFLLMKKEHWDVFTLKLIEEKGDRVFAFHWLNSDKIGYSIGKDVADAFRKAGYGGGAINALDYYEQVDLAFIEKHMKHVTEVRKRIDKAREKSKMVTAKLLDKLVKFDCKEG